MKLARITAAEGIGGYYWRDQEAIARGAKPNGFLYEGAPCTPGLGSIVQVSPTVLLSAYMDDEREIQGDCATVNHAFRSGRDQAPVVASLIALAEGTLSDWIRKRDLHCFRELAAELDRMEIGGKRLHMALRYGMSQILLQAVASARNVTMTEVVAAEYGLPLIAEPCALLGSCGGNWYENVDKAILRRLPFFPQTAMVRVDQLDALLEYAGWISKRIREVGPANYAPTLHYDLHGLLVKRTGLDIDRAVAYLMAVEAASAPYSVLFEDPVDAGDREAQVSAMRTLRRALQRSGSGIRLIADEWCNTCEDVSYFVNNEACDVIQVKTPDLGGVDNTIEASIMCKHGGVDVYLGGSCNETDVSARVGAHIALAVRPTEFLAKPGLGLDEGVMIVTNEMARAIRSYSARLPN